MNGADLALALAQLTAPDRVSTTLPDRSAYARDLWPRGLLGVRAGEGAPHAPDAVVWPETVAEVQAIVRLAAAERVALVPFGAGSGVCGGTLPLRRGVVVDLKRMRRLVALDREQGTATFEAGVLGEHLEHELNRRGYTLGHFPSSIMCSTLGGWLAARSAGQYSSRYGKIEDMVRSLEFVSGTGARYDTSGWHGSIDWNQLLVGSEGTLGIITRAELAIQPAPEVRHLRGFVMPRLATGCEALRRVMQRGLRPSVMRLYDEFDTQLARRSSVPDSGVDETAPHESRLAAALDQAFAHRAIAKIKSLALGMALRRPALINLAVDSLLPRIAGGCLLIVGTEGDHRLADAEAKAIFRELEAAGGQDLGPGPGERWLAHRYDVSFKQSPIFAAGGFADTMEVAIRWDRLLDLYHAVRAAVAPYAFIMAHFSHAYRDGCSIYFTFAGAAPDPRSAPGAVERRYDQTWRAALSAVTRIGATISHHHGVGLAKAAFMPDEHGAAMAIFRALKRTLDPSGILNPGKMGL